jgi:hypothetical protein
MNKDNPVCVSDEQRVFARVLEIAVRLAFLLLVAGLAVYLSGALNLSVPLDQLPALWGFSAAEFVARTGGHRGWGFLDLGAGEVAVLGSIAYLLSVSTLCICILPPIYARRRDGWFLAITLLGIGVLIVAASGVVTPR